MCDWFNCDAEGTIQMIGVDVSSGLPQAGIGRVCELHFEELRDTFALYRAGSQARRDRGSAPLYVSDAPINAPADPNMCACGHYGSAHRLVAAYSDSPPGCYACEADGRVCGHAKRL